jgi:AcrR family transcriptional regulator
LSQSEKRAEIIRAAMELIAEHGFHGAPMSLVAKRAGVAAGTIYCYFASKDVLIKEVHASLEKEILAVLTKDFPAQQSVHKRFLHIGCKLVDYFLASPMEFLFVEQFYNSPFGAANRREKFFGNQEKNIVVKLFEEALEQRLIKDLPLPVLFALMFGPLVDVCRDHILEFFVLDDSLVNSTVAACWDGIKRS